MRYGFWIQWCLKIRMARANKGKVRGCRVYYFFIVGVKSIFYDCSQKVNKMSFLSIKEKIQIDEIIKVLQFNETEL